MVRWSGGFGSTWMVALTTSATARFRRPSSDSRVSAGLRLRRWAAWRAQRRIARLARLCVIRSQVNSGVSLLSNASASRRRLLLTGGGADDRSLAGCGGHPRAYGAETRERADPKPGRPALWE